MRRKKDEKLLRIARKRFNASLEKETENREEALEDLEFLAGDQWPKEIYDARTKDLQPCLTINRLPGFVRQLITDARQNQPSIKVVPVDSNSDPETAEVINGLIRQIEATSNADQAYDTALEQAASSGFGFFRILTEYADDDVFEQDIRIKRITNNFSCSWDNSATEYDKSDARYWFISEWIDEDIFEEKYPKAQKVDWESDTSRYDKWYDRNKRVRVAEYWVKEPTTKTIYQLDTGQVTDIPIEELAEQGLTVVRSRTVKTHKIIRYVITGAEVLETQEWAGKYIPIVPVFGPELHIKDRTIYYSLIRFARDPARLYNYWQSAITEKIALAPKAPFLATPRQVEGHQTIWNNANRENRAWLPYNPDPQAPPPGRQQPAALNPAELQQAAQAIDDIKATMSMYDASIGARSNETSGVAIRAREMQGDAATFTWLDNLSRSITYAGKVLIDLIPRIYDTERTVRVLGEDGQSDFQVVNEIQMTVNGPVKVHDLTAGKYDLVVTVGPSYATQRIESQDTLVRFAQAVPVASQVAPDLIARTLDIKDADELAKRLRKTLPPGMVEPEDGEMPQQPPPPTPEQLIELQKAESDAQKAQLDIEGKQLDNEQKKLELAEKTGQMQGQIEATVVNVLQRLNQGVM